MTFFQEIYVFFSLLYTTYALPRKIDVVPVFLTRFHESEMQNRNSDFWWHTTFVLPFVVC